MTKKAVCLLFIIYCILTCANGNVRAMHLSEMIGITVESYTMIFRAGEFRVEGQGCVLHVEFIGSELIVPRMIKHTMASRESRPSEKVVYEDIWPGITVEYKTAENAVSKSTYYISSGQPGNPVNQIRLKYDKPIRLDKAGNLMIETGNGEMKETAPIAWQIQSGQKKSLPVQFVLLGEYEVGFAVEYDPQYMLVIDPLLSWSTFIGGDGSDGGRAMALDEEGNIYVTGGSDTTWGTPLREYAGNGDAFVAKLTNDGHLLWNTFMGGAGVDSGNALVLDSTGKICVTGKSDTTWGAPVRAYSGGYDAFVAQLDNNGNLLWNTFLGGSSSENGNDIVCNSDGNIYTTGISGATWGTLPVSPFSESGDAFVARLNSSGVLQWYTFAGGDGVDSANGIEVDKDSKICIAGYSDATWGSPRRIYLGGQEAFVAQLDETGLLQWNTFLGSGFGNEIGFAIAVDGNGNIYTSGYSTSSWGGPIRDHSSVGYDAFVTKLDNNGGLNWNTFLGGDGGTQQGNSIAVDGNGNVFVSGISYSTWGTPATSYVGYADAFVAKLDNNGGLKWNAFVGSTEYDTAVDIETDSSGNVFIVGNSKEPWGTPIAAHQGEYAAFVAQIPPYNPTETVTPSATNTHVNTPTISPTISPTLTFSPTPTISPTLMPCFPNGCYVEPTLFCPYGGRIVRFITETDGPVKIYIMNIRGQVVRTTDQLEWDGRSDNGHLCEGGVYIYQIEAEGKRVTGKVVLIK